MMRAFKTWRDASQAQHDRCCIFRSKLRSIYHLSSWTKWRIFQSIISSSHGEMLRRLSMTDSSKDASQAQHNRCCIFRSKLRSIYHLSSWTKWRISQSIISPSHGEMLRRLSMTNNPKDTLRAQHDRHPERTRHPERSEGSLNTNNFSMMARCFAGSAWWIVQKILRSLSVTDIANITEINIILNKKNAHTKETLYMCM